jgi:hypothetical protein
MKTVHLPEGGKAWFVRRRKGWHCTLTPASIEGHVLTIVYALAVSAVAWFFAGGGDIDTPRLAALIVMVLAATVLFILTAWRMSASVPAASKGSRKCS